MNLIELPQGHTAEDLAEPGRLRPETVEVRFVRNTANRGCYDVEISILDAPWTFTDHVAEAIERQTALRARRDHSRCIIAWTCGKKFRAPRGFVRVENLPTSQR